MQRIIVFIYIALLLLSCSKTTEQKTERDESKKPEESKLLDGFKVSGDSIALPSFKIAIELSDKAEKKLTRDNETIVVQAYLSGTPKDSAPSLLVDEMGQMNLGSPSVELKRPGTAVFKSVKISRKSYDLLANNDFHVLINVFSGRRSTELNLLECDILEASITEVNSRKHVLKGKLIGE
ncbi:hypothetical protein BH09BAC3_BH09BAC3_26080 [soil metagenome]